MGFPDLYVLPDDPENKKYVKPSPTAYGGYSYQTGWKETPLIGKIMFVVMFFVAFPPMWALYYFIWHFFFKK